MFTSTDTLRHGFVRKVGIVLAGLGVLALAGGTALAGGHGKGGRRFFHQVSAKLAKALDSVNATPEQRTAIQAAKEQAFAALQPIKKQMRERRMAIKQLKHAEQPDQARITQLKEEQKQARAQMVSVGQSFMATAAAQLNDAQKKLLADFVQQNGEIFKVHAKKFKRGA